MELASVGPARGGADVVDHLVDRLGNGVVDHDAAFLHLGDHLVGKLGSPVLADFRSELLFELLPSLRLGEPRILEFLAVQVAGDETDDAENDQQFD